jgi:hypothetical protein
VGDVREPDAPGDPPELLCDERVQEVVSARAAVLLGDGHTHQVEVGQLLENLAREAVLVLDLLGDGAYLRLAELPDRLASHPVFLGEREVHASRVGRRDAKSSRPVRSGSDDACLS